MEGFHSTVRAYRCMRRAIRLSVCLPDFQMFLLLIRWERVSNLTAFTFFFIIFEPVELYFSFLNDSLLGG